MAHISDDPEKKFNAQRRLQFSGGLVMTYKVMHEPS